MFSRHINFCSTFPIRFNFFNKSTIIFNIDLFLYVYFLDVNYYRNLEAGIAYFEAFNISKSAEGGSILVVHNSKVGLVYYPPFGGDGPNGAKSGGSFKNKAKLLRVRTVFGMK